MSKDEQIDRAIMGIIQGNGLREQSDIQELLKVQGHEIPQATLSRRLKKLKIAKIEGVYKLIELKPSFLPPVLKIDVSEPNLIVLHTPPGYAASLAENIDRTLTDLDDSGVLGTIAGDDTVLMIVNGKKSLDRIYKYLEEKLL